jgi:hypothetical protein
MHESARTDLWEPWGSNPPGRPGPCSLACLDDERRARLRTIRDLEAELAGLLVKTPYMLLLSFPGINVVSAAEFAAEMGPIANSPGDAAITGRAGIYPSRYQSDAVDHSGPLVRRGNRPLRYVILLIAENLLRCNDHFRALGAAWRAAGANRRVAVVRAAKRFCRIAYRMVAGRQDAETGTQLDSTGRGNGDAARFHGRGNGDGRGNGRAETGTQLDSTVYRSIGPERVQEP